MKLRRLGVLLVRQQLVEFRLIAQRQGDGEVQGLVGGGTASQRSSRRRMVLRERDQLRVSHGQRLDHRDSRKGNQCGAATQGP
jgi:hypothetical protein